MWITRNLRELLKLWALFWGALGLLATPAQAQAPSQPATDAAQTSEAETLAAITALEANALYETGDTNEAEAAAQAALVLDPENQTALTVLAMAGDTDPDWRNAVARWDEVARLGEGQAAIDAADRADEIARLRGPFGTLEAFFFGDDDTDQQFGVRASGRIARARGPSILLGLEARRFEDQAGRRFGLPQGGQVEEDRVTVRAGAEFYPDLGRIGVQLVSNGDTTGALTSVDRAGRDYLIRAELNLNRPYYDFSEAVPRDAAVDELIVTGGRTVGRLFLDGRIGARNYTVEDREDAAESALLSAGVTYRFGEGATAFRIASRFDGEFVSGETLIQRPPGPPIRAIPVRDLEIVSIGAFKRFQPTGRRDQYIDLGAGFREDLDREGGPFIRAEGALRIAPEITLTLDAEYTEVATRRANDEAFSFVTIGITRTFPTMGRRS